MKIYTTTGDQGLTSLVGGTRVSKADIRIEAYGTIDELNAHIAVLAVSCQQPHPAIYSTLLMIQNKLFNIGSYLANESENAPTGITDDNIAEVERLIDKLYESLPTAFRFVLPGGSRLSAEAEVCRTVARRAERRIVALAATATVDGQVLRFVNRISDLFFAIGRYNNITSGHEEIFWKK